MLALSLLCLASAVAGPVRAGIVEAPAPSIWSDKADYSPGERVTLTGENWSPGEMVHIRVNDDMGETWSREVDVVVAEDGTVSDHFDLPDWFVASYRVVVTGASGAVATTSFTDASLKVFPAPSGSAVSFTLAYQGFTNSSCTTGAGSTATEPISNDMGGETIQTGGSGVLSGKSFVKFSAPANAGAPAGWTFASWSPRPGSDNQIASTTQLSICVRIPSGGSNDAYSATYTPPANSAPQIARSTSSVTLDEGEQAANTGTWSDANAGDTVTLTASVGTVTKSGTNAAGTWSWSFETTDGPGESQTVTITASDGKGGVTATTFALAVNNVAPTATLGNDGPIEEGGSATVSFANQSDPSEPDSAAGLRYAFRCDGSAFSPSPTYSGSGAAPSASCVFDDNGLKTVRARLIDKDGGYSEYTTVVAVSNVAPTASFDVPLTVNEGSDIHLSLTDARDVSAADTVGGFQYAFDCGAGYGGFVTGNSTTCATSDDETRVVKGKVRDKDGGTREYTASVEVVNVAPTVSGPADQGAEEGESKAFALGTFADPGADGPWTVEVDWGDGSSSSFTEADAGAIASTSHVYGDDGDYTVEVVVSEAGAGVTPSGSDMFRVSVANVAPTVSLTAGPTEVDEDQDGSQLYSFSVFDPGEDGFDVVSGFPDCGDGGVLVAGSLSTTVGGGSFRCRFADGPADPAVSVQVRDADEAAGSSSADSNVARREVEVRNVAPIVNLTGPDTADEGETKVYGFTLSDPGADMFAFVDDYPACGSYGELVGAPAIGEGSFRCRFPDGPETTSVAVKVADDDGGVSAPDVEHVDIISVVIANVAPTVSAPADQVAEEGESKGFALGFFSDPGADSPWTVEVDWGDGSSHSTFDETAPGPASAKEIADGAHAYADNGSYTVTVRLADEDGAHDSETFTVNVANVAPDVELSGAASADEGDTKSYSYTWTDPSPADTFPAAGNSVGCGPKGTVSDHVFTPASRSGSFKCTFGDDSGSGTFGVSVTVTDDDGGAGSDTKQVAVANVVPVASSGAFVLDPVLGLATASFRFSDAGFLDTHAPFSFFTWSGVGNRTAAVSETNGTGSASDTVTLAPGCYSLTVTGTASDDDGGASAALSIYSDPKTSVYGKAFRAPIQDNERNVARFGNVVPVKVVLTNTCTSTTVTSVPLFITLAKGTGSEAIEDTNVIAESVSSADSGSQMRVADGMYIFNLTTKNLTANIDWTVRIRSGSTTGPVLLQAVLYPKR